MKLHNFVLILLFTLVAGSISAQVEWNVSGTTSACNNINDAMYRMGRINLGHDNAPIPNQNRMLDIDAGTVTYGNTTGLWATGAANGSTAVGTGTGSVGTGASFVANGAIRGVSGYAQNVTLLDVNVAGRTSSALGGYFQASITDPIVNPANGNYLIGGAVGDLSGTITTYPNSGILSGLIGRDLIQGANTWAGYFQGRSHFTGNVGIATTNPLATLSVNGDGDSRFSIYGHTSSTVSGNSGVVGQADQPTGFADHVRGVLGTITSGRGYTYGVYGSAYNGTASSQGRSYGVFGTAGNATSNYNYGLYGRLIGQNNGTAILGHDYINHPGWNGNTQGTWAGYFVGDVHVTDQVAIGTVNRPAMSTVGGSDYLLYVGGGALFEEVKVQTGWADYVFQDDYQLTALEDVEQHIESEGHLHNTPSAAEVESEGLDLGTMTVNQQEKIEEIFLHLIEMNKELKTLKAENESLKAELSTLKN